MMRRGKALLEGSRQGSVDGSSNMANDKELVHKCHSDPGGGRALGATPRGHRHRSASGAPRKCVLTLDGYSYVIGICNKVMVGVPVASPPGGAGAPREEAPRPPPPPAPRNGTSPKVGSYTMPRRSRSSRRTKKRRRPPSSSTSSSNNSSRSSSSSADVNRKKAKRASRRSPTQIYIRHDAFEDESVRRRAGCCRSHDFRSD